MIALLKHLKNNNSLGKMSVDRQVIKENDNQIYLIDTFLIHPSEVQGCKVHLTTINNMNHDSKQVVKNRMVTIPVTFHFPLLRRSSVR